MRIFKIFSYNIYIVTFKQQNHNIICQAYISKSKLQEVSNIKVQFAILRQTYYHGYRRGEKILLKFLVKQSWAKETLLVQNEIFQFQLFEICRLLHMLDSITSWRFVGLRTPKAVCEGQHSSRVPTLTNMK